MKVTLTIEEGGSSRTLLISGEDQVSPSALPPPILFSSGDTVFRQGSPANFLYLIKSGRVKVVTKEDDSDGVTSSRIASEGTSVGMESIAGMAAYSGSAIADGDCSLVQVSASLFTGNEVIEHIARSAVDLAAKSKTSLTANTKERLALFLKGLVEDGGEQEAGGWHKTKAVAHRAIAEVIGAPRETVTVYLSRLRRDGKAFKASDGNFNIHLSRLQKWAES